MRRLFRALHITNRDDCTFATALVRPVAMQGRRKAQVTMTGAKTNLMKQLYMKMMLIVNASAKYLVVTTMKLTCGVEHLPKRNEEKVMQFYELIGTC